MATTTRTVTSVNEGASRDWLKVASVILAVIGLLISAYLVWAEVTNAQTICPQTGGFNCDLVQKSVYSRVGPIPVAILGLVGYAAILLALLLETRVPFLAERGKLLVLIMTLAGVLFSGYLTAIEAFVLYAWCVWCVGSAVTMLLLFVVSFMRQWRSFGADLDEEEE